MRLALLLGLAACGRLGFSEADPDDLVSTTARVTVANTGSGTVVGPNGFTCTAQTTCTLDVEKGTAITLRGLAAADAWFAGWTTDLCGGNFDCTFATDDDAMIVADFTTTPNRAFVTSTTTDGAFGGILAADALCTARANAAGLSGTFIAYVSDASTNAPTRLAGSRGWVRTDGAPYADAPTAFTDGSIVFPPRLDEYGNDLGSTFVYSGTNFGSKVTNRCNEWTSNLGTDNGGMARTQYAASSLASSNRACTTQGHLLCLEVGRVVPVEVRPDTGKLAFATRTGWAPGGGRISADALCTSEAADAGLGGTFLAAMATTTESIASRFPAGEVYRRADGVRLLRTAGLFGTDWLDVPAELDAAGGLVIDDLWTGSTRFDTVATAANNCNDWTSTSSAATGYIHFTGYTDMRTPLKTSGCNGAAPVLCLEQ